MFLMITLIVIQTNILGKLKTPHCLLSHQSYTEVSSAVPRLTTEFGMGSGRAAALETRGDLPPHHNED